LFGEAGSRRLAWDVPGEPGATDLIVHSGSNDLRFGIPGARLIEAFQQVVKQARQSYRRVFGTTILPGGYAPGQVEQRHLVNTWLREQGRSVGFSPGKESCHPERDNIASFTGNVILSRRECHPLAPGVSS
jgi:hypothetical protein